MFESLNFNTDIHIYKMAKIIYLLLSFLFYLELSLLLLLLQQLLMLLLLLVVGKYLGFLLFFSYLPLSFQALPFCSFLLFSLC